MSSIKKHQCPSCGGNLIIDNEKQLYHCTFCGSEYEYEYFREDQMLHMGETYLLRKEYDAAVDAYKFVLTKDPHNFSALRGLMLAAAHFEKMDDLIREDHSRDFTFDAGLVSDAVDGALITDKDYFIELKRIYSNMKDLSERNEEIDTVGRERRDIGEEKREKEKASIACNFTDKHGRVYSPKSMFVLNWIRAAVFTLLTSPALMVAFSNSGKLSIMLAVVVIGVDIWYVVQNIVFVYPKINKKKELDQAVEELSAKLDKISARVKYLNDGVDKLSEDIRLSSHEFVKNDVMILREMQEGEDDYDT